MNEIEKLRVMQKLMIAVCIMMAIVLVMNVVLLFLGAFDQEKLLIMGLLEFVFPSFWMLICGILYKGNGTKIAELEKNTVQPQA